MPEMRTTPTELRARLRRDHERLDQLFELLLGALRADARSDSLRLWKLFDEGLSRHMALEERFLFPVLARDEPRESAKLLNEHAGIRTRLAELGVGVDLHDIPAEMVSDFIDELRRHAEREDALAYRWAEQHLQADEKQSLEQQLNAPDPLHQNILRAVAKGARAPGRSLESG